MRIQQVKEAAELVGIVSILVTLILIWFQIRQAELIAVADFNVNLFSARVATTALIGEHSDLWSRGVVGDELSDSERIVFEEILGDINTRWFLEHRHMTRLGELEQAEAILNDWAAYLHARPGLRESWASREQRQNENRRLLSPESEATFGWAEAIRSRFEVLDRAGD